MKRRLVPAVALLTLSLSASLAYAQGLEPKTGSWAGEGEAQEDSVGFELEEAGSGYRVAKLKYSVGAGCDAPNPRDSTYSVVLKGRNVAVKLRRSGGRLRGSKTLKVERNRGKATETTRIAVNVASARRAKVVVSAKYDVKRNNPQSNREDCDGRLSVTARPE